MQDFRKKGTFLFNEHEHKPDFRRILHFHRSQTLSFFGENQKDQNELVFAEESGQEVFRQKESSVSAFRRSAVF